MPIILKVLALWAFGVLLTAHGVNIVRDSLEHSSQEFWGCLLLGLGSVCFIHTGRLMGRDESR